MSLPTALDATREPPLLFRGNEYRGRKRYRIGTHRAVTPQETLERIRPTLAAIGLTRIADITGLDRIGLPVVLAVRPAAMTLAVDAGKGLTLETATASAGMESIERYQGEQARPAVIHAAYLDLAQNHRVIPESRLALTRDSLFHEELPERWSLGWDIVNQEDVAVPTDTVGMGKPRPCASDLASFQSGSNGLASGNTFAEAVCAAVHELVERDAVTCHLFAQESTGHQLPRVQLESIRWSSVRDLLRKFEQAQVRPILFDCTVDTNVPTYMAVIYDLLWRNVGLFRGYGAHLDPEIAMSRALTEAAQGRAVYISASRDDFFQHRFLRLKKDDDRQVVERLEAPPATVDASSLQSDATDTFEGDLQLLLGRLKSVGLDQAIVFDLTEPGSSNHVVRAVVPGLEGYLFDFYTPGSRARCFCDGESQ